MIDFTDEQKMASKALRAWAEKELLPLVAQMESGKILPYDTMRKFVATFGLDGLVKAQFDKLRAAAPGEKQRGSLGDAGLSAVMAMELTRICPGFMLAFGASIGLCGGAIMSRGSLAQKEKWALPVLLLEKIGAWGMTEPGAGSDAFGSMRTVARADGDFFVLNGQKTFITNAPYAETFVIYAKLVEGDEDPRTRPIQGFIVDKGTPGLTVGPPMDKMGMHSSPTGEIFLADVRIPRHQLLGEGVADQAREQARDVFHNERTSMVPMCLGIIERCLELSLAYAKEREAWGKKIAEYQLMQEKLARMYMHRENVRNLLLRTLEKQHKRAPISQAEASAMKLYCGRAATEVALEAIQIFGGNGYMREYHVEMLMRDAKLLQIGGGTDEIQIVTIARQILRDGL